MRVAEEERVKEQARKAEEAERTHKVPESQRSAKKAETVTKVYEDRDTVLAGQILEALGGRGNVESVEGFTTDLRLLMKESGQIDDARLKSLGAAGVIKRGRIAQIVMGTQSDRIAERMKNLMKEASEEIVVEEERVTSQGRDKGENKRKRDEFITSTIKTRLFPLYFQAFALLTGSGLLIDLFIHQDLNRFWAVGFVILSVPLIYLLGYRKAIHFLPISLIGIISAAVVFGMAFYFSRLDFDHPVTSQLWFNLIRTLWLGRQVNFGLIVGGIVGIIVGMQLIHSDLHDFWPWWFGTIVGGMVLLSLGWLIVAIFALLFQWGLGFGYGWDTSLIVAVMSYFTIVGLIHLCYVCIVAYKIPVRKLLSFFQPYF